MGRVIDAPANSSWRDSVRATPPPPPLSPSSPNWWVVFVLEEWRRRVARTAAAWRLTPEGPGSGAGGLAGVVVVPLDSALRVLDQVIVAHGCLLRRHADGHRIYAPARLRFHR